MLKSILEMLDHPFPMLCVLVFIFSAIALPISISANIITKAAHADIYYQKFGEIKNERVNNSL